MKSTDVVREIMKNQGVGPSAVGDAIRKPARLVTDRLAQSSITVGKLDELLRVLGYKIVIVPSKAKRDGDWYEVEE